VKRRPLITLSLCVIMSATGCGGNATQGSSSGKPDAAVRTADAKNVLASGTVIQTTNVTHYTYVLVDTGGPRIWAAGPRTRVAVGDFVTLPQGMLMKAFHSRELDRTFDNIYFVPSFDVGAQRAGQKMPADHPAIHTTNSRVAVVDFAGIVKPKGGKTVFEVIDQAGALAGKQVSMRGRAVKYNANILGINWLHVQDGTGPAGSNDLVVTTSASVSVGDMILIHGPVAVDRDFGLGYKYSVMLENAKVEVE